MIGVFPAPAGMNRLLEEDGITIRRVPRARGDEPRQGLPVQPIDTCSPRPRG